MGRSKQEGCKQIARQLDNPRVQLVEFYSGKTKMKLWVSVSSYRKMAAGLQAMGYVQTENTDQQA